MYKKMRTTLIVMAVVVPLVVTQSAWAGSKQRHRWEGAAIGLGAALVGNALVQAYGRYCPPACAGYCQSRHRYAPPPVNVYPQTQVIYHTRETIRMEHPRRHHRKP